MTRTICFLLLAALAATGLAQETGQDDAIDLFPGEPECIELRPGESKTFTYIAEVHGESSIWAHSEILDVTLEIRAGGKSVGSDDDSGGGRSAHLKRLVQSEDKLTIIVTGKSGGNTPGNRHLVEVAVVEIEISAESAGLADRLRTVTRRMNELRSHGEAKMARKVGREAMAWLPPDGGRISSDLADAVEAFGRAFYELRLPEPASRAWDLVRRSHEQTLPRDHIDLQAIESNYAHMLRDLGRLEEALPLQAKVLRAAERTLPGDDPRLQISRLSYALTLKKLGDLDRARSLEEKVLEVRERTLPDDDPALQRSRMNYAVTLKTLGRLREARALEQKALRVFERVLPAGDRFLQGTRNNYAQTLKSLGDLAAARAIEEKVLRDSEKTLPVDDLELQRIRHNHARTLRSLGDVRAARSLMDKVVEVRERLLPETHPDLLRSLLLYGSILHSDGEYAPARKLFERVLEVQERTLPPSHPALLTTRNNLASALDSLGETAAARDLFRRNLRENERRLPEGHRDLQLDRMNLANTLRSLGILDEARALERAALEVLSKTLPKNHVQLITVRRSYAGTLFLLGTKAWSELDDHLELHLDASSDTSDAIAESSRRVAQMVMRRSGAIDLALSFRRPGESSALDQSVFHLAEELGTLVARSSRLHGLQRDWTDPALATRLEASSLKVTRARRRLTDFLGRASSRTNDGGAESLASLVLSKDAAERDLRDVMLELPVAVELSRRPTLLEIAGSLPEGSSGVRFHRYRKWTVTAQRDRSPDWTAADHLVAFVLTCEGELTRVELGAAANLERLIGFLRGAIGSSRGRGIDAENGGAPQRVKQAGTELRKWLIDPVLDAAGKETARLVITLSDDLHAFPMEALPFADGSLADRYRIDFVQGLSWLSRGDTSRAPNPSSLLAIGGIDFRSDARPINDEKETGIGGVATRAAPEDVGVAVWERTFDALPHSEAEVRALASIFRQVFESPKDVTRSLVLVGDRADKVRFFRSAPKARYLHLATHGFFAPDSVPSMLDPQRHHERYGIPPLDSREEIIGYEPLSLCGLALAGAMRPPQKDGTHPGLLTGNEIAAMDLSGVELAVLSACDTNVGVRRAGQGIMSLQEALFSAGVRYTLTSLWKVPDEATKKLMTRFYEGIWRRGETKREALWNAKKMLRDEKDPRTGKPRYRLRDWAGWVLFGNPE